MTKTKRKTPPTNLPLYPKPKSRSRKALPKEKKRKGTLITFPMTKKKRKHNPTNLPS